MLADAGASSKATPDRPQVRYFTPTDQARAASVLSTLKQQYPDAKLVRLGIHAPKASSKSGFRARSRRTRRMQV